MSSFRFDDLEGTFGLSKCVYISHPWKTTDTNTKQLRNLEGKWKYKETEGISTDGHYTPFYFRVRGGQKWQRTWSQPSPKKGEFAVLKKCHPEAIRQLYIMSREKRWNCLQVKARGEVRSFHVGNCLLDFSASPNEHESPQSRGGMKMEKYKRVLWEKKCEWFYLLIQ